MNGAELSLKIYRAYGLNSGKSLIEAHSEYTAIKEKYGEISCQARDHDTGNVFTISNAMVYRYVNETYQELSQAMSSKSNSVSTTAEKKGCSWIANYMKEKFGNLNVY